MRQQHPDVVVVSQGRIESGSLGLLAAKRAGYFTISYLPVAHSVSVSGKPFGVRIRDMVNRHFYRLPDRIITISETARRMLRERGAAPEVVVVPNAVQSLPIKQLDRQRFRAAHGVSDSAYLVATIGRIHFRDKGQDFAIKAIARRRHELQSYSFAFVGEGPDASRLREMISAFELSEQVKLLPWTPNPAEIYAGIDMLLIPSRFEGVPLVMLEAMSYKVPIVASDSDGMAEMLPREWLFPFGNYQALADRLISVRNAEKSRLLDLHHTQVMEGFSLAKFRERVSAAILE
jgi:glycosyltransferase involved in cell wall biosynthesis